jgi:hypothetical protein
MGMGVKGFFFKGTIIPTKTIVLSLNNESLNIPQKNYL